jgi:nicotinate-nucleotide pyrophosphorylase (carboxylating)
MIGELPPIPIEEAVRAALAEDLGRAGDVTTQAIIPANARARAAIVARQSGVVAGIQAARAAFALMDPQISFEAEVVDGARIAPGAVVAMIFGPARPILSAERVALNFLGQLSGVATLTARYVSAIAGAAARICDTRKTTPLLRALEKYAVRCGGGVNHRFGLDDAVLIKDNHVAVAGGVIPALKAAKANVGHLVKIEIEVDTLDQLREVLEEGADAVLLDNMTPNDLRSAVALVGGRMTCEASGGVTLANVAEIAKTGVDLISVGALTHSAPVFDFGLDIEIK